MESYEVEINGKVFQGTSISFVIKVEVIRYLLKTRL